MLPQHTTHTHCPQSAMITDQLQESSSTYRSPSTQESRADGLSAQEARRRARHDNLPVTTRRRDDRATIDRALSPQTLGWLSVGLGLTALLAPRSVGALTGLGERSVLLRLVGCRELASGMGLLSQRQQSAWLWSRVAGDAMDLALILSACGPGNPARGRALTTAGVVAAITAADVTASIREPSRAARPRYAAEATLSETLVVNKTPQECYEFWRNQANLGRFMSAVESVTALDERRSRWKMRGPMRSKLEWTSEITADAPGSHVGWRTLDGSDVEHAGVVRFHPAAGGRGTLVRVAMRYRPPLGGVFARLLGKHPRFEVREDLRRFKQLMETGEIPTTRGQPSGPRSLFGRML